MRTASAIGQLLLALEPVAQRLAVDERHDVVEQCRPLRPNRCSGEDVRMLQVRGGLDLGQEALGAEGRAELGIAAP